MNRIRFGIVGSGWRSLYYVRIAKALPDLFEVTMMLCRTPEKAERIREEQKIPTTISETEFVNAQPEFIVVAVDKAHVADVSMEWLQKGYPVLCETPGAYDERTLELFKNAYQTGQKLVTAEQYLRYPENSARKKIISQNLIGEPYYAYLSLAHE